MKCDASACLLSSLALTDIAITEEKVEKLEVQAKVFQLENSI